jgi:hypothetical protein
MKKEDENEIESTKIRTPINARADILVNQTSNLNDQAKSKNILHNLNNSENNNRRYSSAPVASKDEQAELIRKQKAKLERHFRRSTQVRF